jgi:hypothetical protein
MAYEMAFGIIGIVGVIAFVFAAAIQLIEG